MNPETDPALPPGQAGPTRFVRTFLVLFGLGLICTLSLIPTVLDQLPQLPPELAELPTPVAVALALANSAVLLAIAVAVGVLVAHRVGLRSLVAERVRRGTAIWPGLRPHVARAFVLGVLFMVVVVAADLVIMPFADTELINDMAAEPDLFGRLLVGVLYGGVVEELLLRWGVMSLLVWIGWRVVQRGRGMPTPALVWTANVLAALLFGLGHLPALAGLVALTPLLVVRTVLLNALGGVLFGWLYWRRSLEVAMVAHAAFHVGLFVVNAGFLLLNLPVM